MSGAAEDEADRVQVALSAIVPTRDVKNPVRYTASAVVTVGGVEVVVDGVVLRREIDPRCGAVLRMRMPRFRHAETGVWVGAAGAGPRPLRPAACLASSAEGASAQPGGGARLRYGVTPAASAA